MFNGGATGISGKKLSFLANVGTLVEPISSKADYTKGSVELPKSLFSHHDQVEQWQTSVPQGMNVLSGWAGRAADILHSTLNTEQTGNFYMPMNYSLSGNSTFQIGESEGQFVMTSNGALGLTGANVETALHRAKKQLLEQVVESPIEDHYRNLFRQTHGRITGDSLARGEFFEDILANPNSLNGMDVEAAVSTAGFARGSIGENLAVALKTIAVREQLKLRRQTVFVEFGGWDHHSELLLNQASMLGDLDRALHSFQRARVFRTSR